MKLDNKHVLITGASSGIGAEFARQLHDQNCSLVLVARREDLLLSLKKELEAGCKESVEILPADLSRLQGEKSCETVVNYIRNNRVDVLINNAGRGSFGEFDTLAVEGECGMIALNVTATTLLAHAALSEMKRRKEGALITTSSVAAFQPLPLMATYAATKAYNFFHTLALHYEYKPYGIKVLAVCPGPTETEFGGVARVPGTVSGVVRDSVVQVVVESIHALVKGRPFVVPCLRSRLLSFACRGLPTTLTTSLTHRMLYRALEKSGKIQASSTTRDGDKE